MVNNKTRRNFLIGSFAVPGTIAAAVALKKNTSNAAIPEIKTAVVGENTLDKNILGKDIYADRLSRFKSEVREKSRETLDDSPLLKLFSDYGFPEGSYKVKVLYIGDKTQSNDGNKTQKSTVKDPVLEEGLRKILGSGKEVVIHDCIWCSPTWCCATCAISC